MKITKKSLITGLGTLLISAAQGAIVYQDTFDAADGIDINTDAGGGLVSGTNIAAGDPFDDATGDAVPQTDFGNRIAWAHTINQFNLTGGFTLNVTFTTAAIDDVFPSFTSSFGIVDEVTAATPDADSVGSSGNLNAYLYTDQESLNTVGFTAANRPLHASATDPGIYTDFGALASASTALNSAIAYGTTQSFTLTVNADGSAAFSLDAASGTLPVGALSNLFTDSVDGAYHFVAYSQGNTGFILNSVSIEAESEPFTISSIEYAPDANTVTLTWPADPESAYSAKYSSDMTNWDFDMGDSITMEQDDENTEDSEHLTKTFNLEEFAVEDAARLFFRIEKN